MATVISRQPLTAVPAAPTADEKKLAQESERLLARHAGRDLRLRVVGSRGEQITLPASAVRVLVKLLSEIAAGNSVALLPVRSELTTQQAAEALGVSRPFLVKLLDEGAIPYRKVGTHRRVLLSDLLAYRQENDRRRLQALDELAAQAQELKMGY